MSGNPKPGVQERILLHLRDYVDYKSSVEVPFALSQMGIANAVAIATFKRPPRHCLAQGLWTLGGTPSARFGGGTKAKSVLPDRQWDHHR